MTTIWVISKVAIYGLALVAGYYLGGGCNDSEIKRLVEENRKHENALVQEIVQGYTSQLEYFENKVWDLKTKKSKLEEKLK